MSTGTMPVAALAVTLMLALPAAHAAAGASETQKPQADLTAPAPAKHPLPGDALTAEGPAKSAAKVRAAAPPRPAQQRQAARPDYGRVAPHQTGVASYYARHFNGRRMANGQAFDPRSDSIAHRTLPFGTRVRITNLSNGRSVYGTVRDRGPFTRGRMLDVSPRIAGELGMLRSGVATVAMWRAGAAPVELAEAE
jgi:rare lipoprotein A